jgi:hypothetical protein
MFLPGRCRQTGNPVPAGRSASGVPGAGARSPSSQPCLAPGPASRLEGSLNQILGQRAIPAGQEAGVPEQLAAVGGEARGEFLGIARGDLLITHPGLRPGAGRDRHQAGRSQWSGTTRPGYGHPGRPAPGRSCPRKAPAAVRRLHRTTDTSHGAKSHSSDETLTWLQRSGRARGLVLPPTRCEPGGSWLCLFDGDRQGEVEEVADAEVGHPQPVRPGGDVDGRCPGRDRLADDAAGSGIDADERAGRLR